MQIIYQARDITEAQIVAGMLEASGIPAHTGGYYLQGGVGELAPSDFANVQVADEDVSAARIIVADYEATPAASGRSPVEAGTDTSERLPGWIITVLVIMLLLALLSLFSL